MAEMRLTKFKVDDWVLVKGTGGKVKAHITEITIQLGYANVEQVKYLCRCFPRTLPERHVAVAFVGKELWFSEIEIEAMPTKQE